MSGVYRLSAGGRIDRSRPLRFTFDGQVYRGCPGDTLASALLANGVRVVGRGAKSRRPRGILTAGAEEPNALVQLETGPYTEPNVRATQIELYDGLTASSMAGKGQAPVDPDPDRYDGMHAHADVLVVGAGPAGLMAALAAGQAGARVILADEQPEPGGTLLGSRETIDGGPALAWVTAVAAELRAIAEVKLLPRATVLGYYDHNYLVIAERRTDHLGPGARPGLTRQRLWHVRARRVVLATGAHERPLVFADNDRPGVMLAGAARAYVCRYGVAPGRRVVVFTNNDSAYLAAIDLADAGLEVAAVIDLRAAVTGALPAETRRRGIEVLEGHAITATRGRRHVAGVEVMALTGAGDGVVGPPRRIDCDLLAMSGGWNPAVHLFSQSRGTLRFDEASACFVPDRSVQAERSVGAARGTFALDACLAEGVEAGTEAAAMAGFATARPPALPSVVVPAEAPMRSSWLVPSARPASRAWRTHFVDFRNDVTAADIRLAARRGLNSVEHVKRYTTTGTGPDQGKTSNINALGILSEAVGRAVAVTGTTTYRPPYEPVSFGLLAGRDRGDLLDPVRVTPIHDWHAAHGAVFENVGQWKRPWYYPRPGEDMRAAVRRECLAARQAVAIVDASTLGKIDIQGPDAAELLHRVYTNAFLTLPVGSCRYGVMCTEDGMVFDDGVTTRLEPHRYLMTTTTGNAARVLDWLEEWLQTEWPELRACCTSVTEQWVTVAIVGPRSREVLRALAPHMALDAKSFPFMTVREGVVAGIRARVFRISFTGELSFEVNVPSWHGLRLWEAAMTAGAPYGITPYGTEAMHVLRAEKGFIIVGQETDGTVTPRDLGMDWIVSKTKDFIGRRSLSRRDTGRADRKQLVGLRPEDPRARLPEGAQLVFEPKDAPPMAMVGHVTSSYDSATLGRTFALALIKGGREHIGRTCFAPLASGTLRATITEP
ncbi:MAG: sarcosine oxidase subunit alpha family protein, partial [Candidatus Rokuibacteriota bacterium]